jgi:dihydropteroate synthase/2-amino-4-hydroxy-6-hydroxymethyldihydropteridine diphosphokinase
MSKATQALIALGSNLGNPRENLERAARELGPCLRRVSPLFQTPALLLAGSPDEWRKPFLNAVAEIEWSEGPQELLSFLKNIESSMGRGPAPRWSPRIIDLDILSFGDVSLAQENLRIPHSSLWERSFVLDPLKHLTPSFRLPGQTQTALSRSRELPARSPLWMGILNLTEDSFSDGGLLPDSAALSEKLDRWEQSHVPLLDFGAQSTRPGATLASAEDEWKKLGPALRLAKEKFQKKIFRPWISVDTARPEVARRAAREGVEMLNDVSGLADEAWLSVLRESSVQYVLMHNLGLPADPRRTLSSQEDPVAVVKEFFLRRLETLDRAGISLERVILDPGIGFGKSASQSLALLKRIDEFFDLPTRLLVGHSRKSFLKIWTEKPAAERDFETLGISLQMARRGVDILRVHEVDRHLAAFQTFQETAP